MATNNNGKSEYRKTKSTHQEIMEKYDALPREYRDVLKDCVMNLTAPDPKKIKKMYPTARYMKSWIKQKDLLGTRDTYGRLHPTVAYK
jgi:hypothetical protein